jgi:hypothetical protein
MIPDELIGAARRLAHSLGIKVYIRDGWIYQHGPGLEFLPPTGVCPTEEDRFIDDDAFSTTANTTE